jgi:hypothetical protein
MAGQPKARADRKKLDKLGEQEVFARLATGTVRAVCAEIGISPPRIYEWLDEEPGRRARYEQVKKMKADLWAEEQIEILDEADGSSTSEVAKARARAEARRWIASKLHREAYGGDGTQVNIGVAITADDAFAAALKKHGMRKKLPAAQRPQIQEADYEVLPDE